MQLLFDESEEFGRIKGLGIFPGRVVRFADRPGLQVPHMGWNQIEKRQQIAHLEGIDDGAFVYFVHSYYVVPADDALKATMTDYGGEFTSAIGWRNVFATQYHPEKSQEVGLKILENFSRLVADGSVTDHQSPGTSHQR
jgi:glutamine amidotransferase